MKKQILISTRVLFFLIFACIASFLYVLYSAHQVAAKESSYADRYKSLKTLTNVLALVEKNYVEVVKTDDLIEGAIKGMLATLDPHSGYLSKENYSELQVDTKGEFGGLGIEITMKDGFLTVVAPIEDSPAARAGVLAGDQIVKIGEEFSKDLSLIDAVKKMRGLKGTSVTISIQRAGHKQVIPITIIRDVIKVKSVRSRILEQDIVYIRLAQFQDGSAKEFATALESLAKKCSSGKIKGLIVDLRNDPGGLLTEAIHVSDIFLKEGVIVYTDGRLESQKQKYYAHDDGVEPNFPMVVLVNGGSASASEILSGALQDDKRAFVVGEQSFGKGSVQTVLPMENGDALRLTTALYYTKSGRSIQAQGVTPDFVVVDPRFAKPKEENDNKEEDEELAIERIKEKDLPGAIKNPKQETLSSPQGESGGKPKEESKQMPIGSINAMEADLSVLLKEDIQLAESLRLLKSGAVTYPLATKVDTGAKSSEDKK